MKNFEDVLLYDQKELKEYLKKYMFSLKRTVIDQDGYLYSPAKGDDEIPVLLTAHMDKTLNVGGKKREKIKEICKIPFEKGGDLYEQWSSPQGIGGDDRCGVWIIMNLIKTHNCSVLFCEDEEIGSVGAKKFCKSEYVKKSQESAYHVNKLNLKYIIELDRHGNNDLVFYTCDNNDFTKWLEDNTEYKTARGTMSDISELMPALKVAGVNFSVGYYDEHTEKETIVIEEMNRTMDTVDRLLGLEIPKKFEYVEKKYPNYNYYGSFGDYYDDYYDNWKYQNKKDFGQSFGQPKEKRIYSTFSNRVDLHVTIKQEYRIDFKYDEYVSTGDSKSEAVAKLFFGVPNLCADAIEDYWFE